MRKSAKDIEIEKLKKQVEKLKSEKNVLKQEKRSLNGKLATAKVKADKYHDALKKKILRMWGRIGKHSIY